MKKIIMLSAKLICEAACAYAFWVAFGGFIGLVLYLPIGTIINFVTKKLW